MLFGVVTFSEGVDHLAVPLAISVLLDCQSSMLLRACAKHLTTSISTISRALLLQGHYSQHHFEISTVFPLTFACKFVLQTFFVASRKTFEFADGSFVHLCTR